jgi:hypothetical protein
MWDFLFALCENCNILQNKLKNCRGGNMGIFLIILGAFLLLGGLGNLGTSPGTGVIFTLLGGFLIYKGINLRKNKSIKKASNEAEQIIDKANKEKQKILEEVEILSSKLNDKQATMNQIIEEANILNKEKATKIIEDAKKEADKIINNAPTALTDIYNEIKKKRSELEDLNKQVEELNGIDKKIATQEKKLSRIKTIYRSVENAIDRYFYTNSDMVNLKLSQQLLKEIDLLAPTVTIKLHSMDVRDLRKAFKENDALIEDLLKKYEDRYTTKQNKSIYHLMVIALRAELQNILYNLKYDRLDKALESLKITIEKYNAIAIEGNQSIAGTILKFIGEAESLFENAIKIEYEYYIKKEKEKEEQAALKEQMRQEAEERRALEEQKKQVEKEEEKYRSEIANVQEIMANTQDEDKLKQLQAKILELQKQLSTVEDKKEEIINRQNGKAGYVYIISNLGSFGDNVFKVGMTRRLDPQDRVNELGDASVPFSFDVHSFIFSEDAVSLEQKLHATLDRNRLNKVNIRKEFFKVSIDELESIVTEIDPAAEFNKTMVALQYRESLDFDEDLELISEELQTA